MKESCDTPDSCHTQTTVYTLIMSTLRRQNCKFFCCGFSNQTPWIYSVRNGKLSHDVWALFYIKKYPASYIQIFMVLQITWRSSCYSVTPTVEMNAWKFIDHTVTISLFKHSIADYNCNTIAFGWCNIRTLWSVPIIFSNQWAKNTLLNAKVNLKGLQSPIKNAGEEKNINYMTFLCNFSYKSRSIYY